MSTVDIPDSLSAGGWDKQRNAMAKDKAVASKLQAESGKVADAVKDLGKLHSGFDFGMFDSKGIGTAAAAAAAADKVAAAVKGDLKTLLGAAKTAGTAADALAGAADKLRKTLKGDSEKVAQAAMNGALAASKAAAKYAADVNAAADAAEATLQALSSKLAAGEKKGGAATPPSAKAVSDGKALGALIKKSITALKSSKGSPLPVRFFVVQENKKIRVYIGPKPDSAFVKLKTQFDPKAKLRKIKDPKGTVVWEKAALTFVSEILKGSLAKQIQIAIREQTKVSVKVRIKKADGTVEEGENVPDLHDDQLKVDASEEAATRADAKEIAKRFAEMQSDIGAGLKGGAGAKVKALVVSYSNNVKQQKFDDAGDDLDAIESLLAGAEEADDDAADAAPAASSAAAKPAGNEQLRKAIPNLSKSRDAALDGVNTLAKSITDMFRSEPTQRKELIEAINKLGVVKKALAGDLESQLQAALDEKDATRRDALAAQAKATAAKVKKYLQSDAVASNIDGNELHPGMKVIGPLMASLDEVASALG